MKRLISLILLVVAGVTLAFAQGSEATTSLSQCESSQAKCDRKPVTSKWSLLSGSASYANHYLSNHQYTGDINGFEAMHGRYFRKSEHLSWKLTLTHLRTMHRELLKMGGLKNAAGTSVMSVQSYEADYAVFYNWTFNRLQVRAGGSFNLYGGYNACGTYSINNMISLDLQTQLFGAAQIRYGWDFEKYGLDIYANFATPLIGMMFVNGRYESFFESIPNSAITARGYKHLNFSSLHNMKGLNFEMGIDFALRRNVTLSFAYGLNNRYWNAHELQDYRKNSLLKIGLSVDFISLPRRSASNRQF